jgi:hypothetical protein
MRTWNDSIKFGIFLMLFNSVYKLVLCLMRRFVTQEDKINAPIAGFISALSLIVEQKSRRQLMAALMMSRFFDTAISVSENKEYIPKIANKAIVMWVLANVLVQSQYGMQPDILNNGLVKFYKTWSSMTHND